MLFARFRIVRPLILPLALLAIWAAASATGLANPYLLPAPGRVVEAAMELAANGELAGHVGASLWRVLAGFAITAATALPLAFLTGVFPVTGDYLRWALEALRVTPPLALIPLLILWLGIGETSKLAIVVLASFFPIYMNALSGIREADHRLVELARTLDLTRFELVLHVLLPAALPGIVNGLRLGFGYSWRALVGAELIAASAGLGYLIIDASEMARTDRVFVGIFAIAGLGAATDWLFRRAVARLMPWRNDAGAAAAIEG